MTTLANVRPAVLRHYYASTYGLAERDGPGTCYEGATVEEFFRLVRVRHPGHSDWAAARYAPRALGLAESRDRLDTTPTAARYAPLRTTIVARQPEVDLATVPCEPGTDVLVVDRVKSVAGWAGLAARELRRLKLNACGGGAASDGGTTAGGGAASGGGAAAGGGAPALLDHLSVDFCDAACLASALAAVAPVALTVQHDGRVRPDPVPDRLRALTVFAPSVTVAPGLTTARLDSLTVANTRADERFWQALSGSTETLRTLTVGSFTAFDPDRLDAFGVLERLEIVGHPEGRERWIDWAVGHPGVACVFHPAGHWEFAKPLALVEVYRGVPVLRSGPPARPRFEIADDVVGVLDLDDDDNGALEDRLKPLARKAKRKVRWGSEADTLVAAATDVETCRWVVDAALTA